MRNQEVLKFYTKNGSNEVYLGNGIAYEDSLKNENLTYLLFTRMIRQNPYNISRHPLNGIRNCQSPIDLLDGKYTYTELPNSTNNEESYTFIGNMINKLSIKLIIIDAPVMTTIIKFSDGRELELETKGIDEKDDLAYYHKLLVIKDGKAQDRKILDSLTHKIDWYITDSNEFISKYNYFISRYVGNDIRYMIRDKVVKDMINDYQYSLSKGDTEDYIRELITYKGQVREYNGLRFVCVIDKSYSSDFIHSKDFMQI